MHGTADKRRLVSAFGARIAVVSDVAELWPGILSQLPAARLGRLAELPSGLAPDVSYLVERLRGGAGLRCERAGCELARGDSAAVLRRLIDALHFDVALHAREASFVHASVVRWHGRLLVFPGRSRAGKSTLAASLCTRGATYYSDEYAPIDETGRVMPYPKSLSLRSDVGLDAGAALGEGSATTTAPDAVVFTRYRPPARFKPREISVETAALSLVDNAVAAVPRPRQTAAAVARLLAHRPRLAEGDRAEAGEFVEALEAWLAHSLP
jgi:hypothetical protein